ncbi:hypothetical protein N7530_004443 [Penicillium desertorum]|uniref:F-box domain-containing protein n=1 Tax=Penicillium desertorum TaxID=1303715 RepID=A0A9W9WYA8_9EURO|nr:hypothetical protein N7530_004443 [Penicillium desertorum]
MSLTLRPKHQGPSGFTSCPADIIYSVFELLSSAELHVLCLVNKKFRGIAEKFLYKKIQLTWQHPYHPPPITQLLRTLISRPHLAAYIKTLHLAGKTPTLASLVSYIRTIPVSIAELNEHIAFIRKTRVPYIDLWIQELQQGTINAFVALLLAQLPNLRCLYLSPAFTQRSEIIGMVLRSAIFEPVEYGLPDLQHLRDVTYRLKIGHDRARDKKVKNTADVLPFFYLPNVQRISVSLESPLAITWPTPQLPVPLTLTSLVLNSVRENYLGDLLSVTPHLKSLRWRWFYDFGTDDVVNMPIVDLDRIGDAISCLRGTLTDLKILAEVQLGGNDINLPGIKTEGSLSAMVNMENLRILQVPLAFLVGFAQDTTKRLQNVLPRYLEHLTITYDLCLQNDEQMEPDWPEFEWEDHAVLGLLKSWLEDRKAFTPNLRGISLGLARNETPDEEWDPIMRHQLTELGAQAGVPFDVIFTDEI